MGGALEGLRVASKGLGPLPSIKEGALGRGCGREGSGALPLPRAAVISTGSRVPPQPLASYSAWLGFGFGFGFEFGFGLGQG